MPSYTIKELAKTSNGEIIGNEDTVIHNIIIDSRSLDFLTNTLFIAIPGKHHDGHKYIPELYKKGICNYLVQKNHFQEFKKYNKASFIVVNNSVEALHAISSFHRSNFSVPVIGITGSNGKTMIKEWLNYVLHDTFAIARSPKSYNSQVGVPLSVWQLDNTTELGIFEAGISMPGEMQNLEYIIKPTIGLITNIGPPHQENFQSLEQKAREKLRLFRHCKIIFYCKDHNIIHELIESSGECKNTLKFNWSLNSKADVYIKTIMKSDQATKITAKYKNEILNISIPYIDNASIENAIHVLCILLYLKIDRKIIISHFNTLPSIEMRMELLKGNNNCTIINDIYNSDFESLRIALDFLDQQNQYNKKKVILSDIFQSGSKPEELYKKIARLINSKEINHFIGIGGNLYNYRNEFKGKTDFFLTTNDFLDQVHSVKFNNEAILLKGSRVFEFEKITNYLQETTHSTILEINLDAMVNNLDFFRSLLKPKTRIMVMVKAFSYGSGTYEIANLLQYHNVDYLAVAFVDEGIFLRKNGINMPVLVMNPEINSYNQLLEYNLEPEIYNFKTFNAFNDLLLKRNIKNYPIHLKIDTGMHRLGFLENEIDELIQHLKKSNFKIQSIFSHLAASEEPEHDDFSKQQYELYNKISGKIINEFDYHIIRHILNSSGIERFPEMQLEMVRLGIGLYGVSLTNKDKLQNISTLKTRISQIKELDKKETVGYNRKGKLKARSRIGIIPVGYADGLNRKTGNGNWKMLVNNNYVPILGNICMDMCMLDLTKTSAKEGDEVEIFGDQNTIVQMAKCIDTIPYEVLTNISQRVKRVYFKD